MHIWMGLLVLRLLILFKASHVYGASQARHFPYIPHGHFCMDGTHSGGSEEGRVEEEGGGVEDMNRKGAESWS